jgi:hypothetical protein
LSSESVLKLRTYMSDLIAEASELIIHLQNKAAQTVLKRLVATTLEDL